VSNAKLKQHHTAKHSLLEQFRYRRLALDYQYL